MLRRPRPRGWRRPAPSAEHGVALLGEVLGDLQGPINRFFTDVLVMADDPAVREARLALVQRIAALPDGIADLSQLQLPPRSLRLARNRRSTE